MRRNVDANGLGPQTDAITETDGNAGEAKLGKVRVSQADAWYGEFLQNCSFDMMNSSLMYSLRHETSIDVIDLDPYGSASPFIDAAVQCINDGGELYLQEQLL